jgi:hypothetical protein
VGLVGHGLLKWVAGMLNARLEVEWGSKCVAECQNMWLGVEWGWKHMWKCMAESRNM